MKDHPDDEQTTKIEGFPTCPLGVRIRDYCRCRNGSKDIARSARRPACVGTNKWSSLAKRDMSGPDVMLGMGGVCLITSRVTVLAWLRCADYTYCCQSSYGVWSMVVGSWSGSCGDSGLVQWGQWLWWRAVRRACHCSVSWRRCSARWR